MRQNRNRLSDVLWCGQAHLARTGMQPGAPLGPYPSNMNDWANQFQALNGRGPAYDDILEWWGLVHPKVRGQCEAHVNAHPTWYEPFNVVEVRAAAEQMQAMLLDNGQAPSNPEVWAVNQQLLQTQLALIQPGMRVMNLDTCRRGTVYQVRDVGAVGSTLVIPRVTYDDNPASAGDLIETPFFSLDTRRCNFVKVLDAAGPLPAFLSEVD